MKDIVDKILLKKKKPISLDKIILHYENIKSKELGESYSCSKVEKKEIEDILNNGVKNYEYILTPSNNYIHILKSSFRVGSFYGDRNGNGKVTVITSYINKDGEQVVLDDKYVIYKDRANGAIDGDRVLIDLNPKTGQPKVEKIIDRNLDHIIGEIYRIGSCYYVKPNDKKKQNIIVSLEGEAIEGQRVLVSLKQQGDENFYVGKIKKVFDHKDDPDEDILWEAFKHGVDNEISNESVEQLKYIPTEVDDKLKIGREDLTNWKIFTIDGIDTKDMDDAISCTINENGNYELGVHITDIASIVPFNSPLDRDAFKKGNSYYLGGKVFPMFDHKISNGIGSLNPYVDRLTISVIMEIDSNGDIINYRITPSVINSKIKMNYNKVNDILKDDKIDPLYSDFCDTLKLMQKLSLILRKKRIKSGAISFNRPESKVVFDDDGKIKDFDLRHVDVAENLIEEFMLAANETVDKHLNKNGLPCVHRVHDMPDSEKIEKLLFFLDSINLPYSNDDSEKIATSRFEFQKFAEYLRQTGRLSNLLTAEGVKCMSRAKYSTVNIGHYGLAKNDYCHFTSPVRRYADLTQQRILWDCVFNKDNLDKKKNNWNKRLLEISERTSYTEKIADDCERDVFRMQACKYMLDHIDDEYEATVIGVYGDSMDVELDNMIEGKIYIRDLKGDYIHNDVTYSLVSLDGFDDYTIGDRLIVKVKGASVEQKRVYFTVSKKLDNVHIKDSDESNRDAKIKAKLDRRKRALS